MKQFLKYTLATIVGLLLFSFVCTVVISGVFGTMLAFQDTTPVLKPHSIYKINLEGVLYDKVDEDAMMDMLNEMSKRPTTQQLGLRDLLNNIRRAKEDTNIDGILLNGGTLSADYASLQELRGALEDFKQSGKCIIAYADQYAQSNYYLASVADKVYLNPYGDLEWSGLYTTLAYFSRLLNNLGVEMQVVKVGEFKSAVETYIQTEMSEANRKQLKELQADLWQEVRRAVSQSRSISEKQLDEYAEKNMLFVSENDLLAYGLVDSLIYQSDIKDILTNLTGTSDFEYISHKDMTKLPSNKKEYIKDKIAIVYAEGEIVDSGTDGIVRDQFLKTLRKVTDNDNIKAVVLRVNSPGGSAYASEQIWHALDQLKEKKPLIVSMGGYAASGGYYISCVADSIFAQENTITGSIGIFGLIPCTKELMNKIGVDFDGVQTHHLSSSNTSMLIKGMTPEEKVLMQGVINRGYELFVTRCAEGRGMSNDEIKKIAEGRVWSGKQALEIGLIDDIGDIQRAVNSAAQMADISKYSTVVYPKAKDSFTQMMELLSGTSPEDVLLKQVKQLQNQLKQSNLQARLPYELKVH